MWLVSQRGLPGKLQDTQKIWISDKQYIFLVQYIPDIVGDIHLVSVKHDYG